MCCENISCSIIHQTKPVHLEIQKLLQLLWSIQMESQPNGKYSCKSEMSKTVNEKDQRIPPKKFMCKINKEIWRYKFHYFLFIGAAGAGFPFIPIIATHRIGISNTAFAIILMVQHFLFVFMKPAIGYLADYFNKIKLILSSLVFIMAFCYIVILAIPKIKSPLQHSEFVLSTNLCIIHSNTRYKTFQGIDYWKDQNETRNLKILSNDLKRSDVLESYQFKICDKINNSILETLLDFRQTMAPEVSYNWKLYNVSDMKFNNAFHFSNMSSQYEHLIMRKYKYCLCSNSDKDQITSQELTTQCICCTESCCYCVIFQSESSNNSESTYNKTYKNELLAYQVWLFAILFTSSMICTTCILSISDAACCENVEKVGAQFGHQRMWGSVGWGIVGPIAGQLNDYTGDYIISWCILILGLVLTIWNICEMNLLKPRFSQNIFKDVKTVQKSGEFLVFEIGVLMNGIGSGIVWNYLILFLTSIGGSKLLCGLALTVQSFLGSIPFMFFSGRIIKTIGHMNVVSLALFTYMLRFMWYSYLKNPWLTLMVEALHGLTYGLLYANIASFGNDSAKPGTEVTTQSLLFTMHEGFGCGLGCILGGIGLDHLGGHMTFFIASLSAGCGFILHQILYQFVRKSKGVMKVTTSP